MRKPWTFAEDHILLNEFLLHGSKWTLISEKLKGRNVFSVKNRFFHLIKSDNGNKIRDAIEKRKRVKSQNPGNNVNFSNNSVVSLDKNTKINENATKPIGNFTQSFFIQNLINFKYFLGF